MPNWVTNRLIITGSERRVYRFIKANIVNDNLDLSVAVPLTTDSYAEAVEKWGTGRVVMPISTRLSELNGQQVIDFATASQPPLAWLDAVACLHPKLRFSLVWHETGMGHYGIYKIHCNDYTELSRYQILPDDVITVYENKEEEEAGENPIRDYAAGRFKKVLDSVGLEYDNEY